MGLKDLGTGPKWFLAGVAFVALLAAGFWWQHRQLVKERAARAHAEAQLEALLDTIPAEFPGQDTVFVHDTVPTTRLPDSTRIAEVSDSGFAGVVRVRAVAPPYPAPLGITIGVHRPPFAPGVALVEQGDTVVAVVNWQGQQVQVGTGYKVPKAKAEYRPPLVSAFVDGRYAHGAAARLSAGAALAVRRWSVFGGLEQEARIGDAVRQPTWFVGAQRSFRIF